MTQLGGGGVLKGSLGGGVPPWPSNPDKIRSFQYPVYNRDNKDTFIFSRGYEMQNCWKTAIKQTNKSWLCDFLIALQNNPDSKTAVGENQDFKMKINNLFKKVEFKNLVIFRLKLHDTLILWKAKLTTSPCISSADSNNALYSHL